MMFQMENTRTGEIVVIEADSQSEAVILMQEQDVDFTNIKEL